MSTLASTEDRAAWLSAHKAEGAAQAAIDDATRPLRAPLEAAQEAKAEIEERLGVNFAEPCMSCETPIFENDPHLPDVDGGSLCEACAPQYADLLSSPDSFVDGDEEHFTAEHAKVIYDHHIAAGGKPTDKYVIRLSA